ncbi:hypothetical protein A4U49_04955 [Acidithiobacillus ferrivorans]|jgi:hypothetical protein|uniref:hypothetical protein n=1 Tax=Acidithiobacillus ferrivorans TaxID=160808 RepID=UPI000892EC0B|nr:hypothetical protein [Acidithiobacillus ferrivorans]MBU2769609.1 hypothetical protein [Acidithiobacillus ferrivorans]OFA16870.1 hypothetical protein A4U49_04955 [Acidithiobacillus ferrivorans]
MKLAKEWDGNLTDLMTEYSFQPELTRKLDGVSNQSFDQPLVNEIVLWKVNRYAPLSQSTFAALNELSKIETGKHKESESILKSLLREPGVDLPMASTLLRFKNPQVFQIIDRHAYRALYGEDYPLYSASGLDNKIKVYFKYLDDLIALSQSKNVDFKILDRVLYVFDKQHNGKL